MASEVQRIIALSLNKIIASRGRRGGINLHRNLLVASVLLRAKDAYIAETVAKRKLDMDNDITCHETSVTNDELLSDAMEDMDTNIPCELNDSNTDSEEGVIISDIDKSSQDCEDGFYSGSEERFEDDESGLDSEYGLSSTCESEQYKENRCPEDASLSVEIKALNNHCVTSCPSKKRHYSELEQAVINIGGQLDSNSFENIGSTGDNNANSINNINCSRSSKIARLDNLDNTCSEHVVAPGHDGSGSKVSDICVSKSLQVNIEPRSSYRKLAETSCDIHVCHKMSSSGRCCGSRAEKNTSLTPSQGILLHSNLPGLLVATM